MYIIVILCCTYIIISKFNRYYLMADKAEGTNAEGEPNLHQPNLLQDAAPTLQTETINPTEATHDMEVHHHAHHGGKKNWKSYFWDFSMLFLAVFCGFLAEYQLEHTIERDREKQYIASMMADMMEDSAKLTTTIMINTRQVAGFDSLLQNIYNRPYTDSSLKVMYSLQRKYTHTRSLIKFTKRTITQLKNSGGLRLIRNKAASDTISFYSEECDQVEAQGDYIEKVRMGKISDYSLQLFDNELILDYKGKYNMSFFDKNVKINLLSDDEKLIKEYANALTYARASLNNYIYMQKFVKTYIPGKLKFLQNKYEL